MLYIKTVSKNVENFVNLKDEGLLGFLMIFTAGFLMVSEGTEVS